MAAVRSSGDRSIKSPNPAKTSLFLDGFWYPLLFQQRIYLTQRVPESQPEEVTLPPRYLLSTAAAVDEIPVAKSRQ